jgi:hypothetical protein
MQLLLVSTIFYSFTAVSAISQHTKQILEIMRPNPYVSEFDLMLRVVVPRNPQIGNEDVHEVWNAVMTHTHIPAWVFNLIIEGNARGDSSRTIAEHIVAHGVESGYFAANIAVNPFVTIVNAWNMFCAGEGTYSTKMQGKMQFYVMEKKIAQKWIDFFISKLDGAVATTSTTNAPFEFEDGLLESVRNTNTEGNKYSEVAVQPLWFIMFLFEYHGGAKPWLNRRIIDQVEQKGKESGNPIIGHVRDAIELWWKIVVQPVREDVDWNILYTIDEDGHVNGQTQPVVRILPEWLSEFQG